MFKHIYEVGFYCREKDEHYRVKVPGVNAMEALSRAESPYREWLKQYAIDKGDKLYIDCRSIEIVLQDVWCEK